MYFHTTSRPVAPHAALRAKCLRRSEQNQHLCSTGVFMGQQHVWTAGSRQQSRYCPSAGQGVLQGKKEKTETRAAFAAPPHRVAATLDRLGALVVCCSSPTACGFGTCPAARATPSSWPTGTACSPSCCTAVSSRSRERRRARGPVKVRGHPAERRATPSGPPCCPSAQRSV